MNVETVAVYLCRNASEVLLLRRHAERGERWVSAGGIVEPGESGEEAAIREVREETALDLDAVVDLRYEFDFERDGRVFHERTYAAAAPAGWEPVLDGVEHDAYRWVTLEEAAELISWPENRGALDALRRFVSAG